MVGKRILLGVSGGIAVYKSPDLVRRLRDAGAEVRVVMTPAAQSFVSPLTFQAVAGKPVRTSLLDAEAEAGMDHIELARWPDLIVIAPATADLMARLAAGMADDLLSTLCLATERPIVLVPAMNKLMWANGFTQDNARRLRERGIALLGPAEGSQACGEIGPGRMLEPLQIVEALDALLQPDGDLLSGLRVLIIAGPTREPIDPVRYISNRSSGKMGFAVAAAAVQQGAAVTMICGPVRLTTPRGVERVDVETAEEMFAQAQSRAPASDLFIAAAAVADYRIKARSVQKIKKSAEQLSLDLVRNPDILAAVAAMEPGPFTVGFAAETNDLLAHAESKRARKGLDMIAANEVGENLGFDRDENALHVLWDGGSKALPQGPKDRLATDLVALIAERYRARD